eukprot:11655439-Karenia_brevis.AAC.1
MKLSGDAERRVRGHFERLLPATQLESLERAIQAERTGPRSEKKTTAVHEADKSAFAQKSEFEKHAAVEFSLPLISDFPDPLVAPPPPLPSTDTFEANVKRRRLSL